VRPALDAACGDIFGHARARCTVDVTVDDTVDVTIDERPLRSVVSNGIEMPDQNSCRSRRNEPATG
jgi:hypothetical protein